MTPAARIHVTENALGWLRWSEDRRYSCASVRTLMSPDAPAVTQTMMRTGRDG